MVINIYWQLFVSFDKAAVQYLLAGLADVTPIFTIFLVQLFWKQMDSSRLKRNRRAGLEGPPTCAYTSRLSLEGGRGGRGYSNDYSPGNRVVYPALYSFLFSPIVKLELLTR